MLATGVKSPVPLNELEIHLREQLERAESIDQKTFDVAVRQLGQPVSIRTEFKKVERQTMKRKIIIAVAVFGFFLGTSIILPALAQHNHRNAAALSSGATFLSVKWATDEILPISLGLVITLGSITAVAKIINAGSKARMA